MEPRETASAKPGAQIVHAAVAEVPPVVVPEHPAVQAVHAAFAASGL